MSVESPPADKRILNLDECFIDVVAPLVTHTQTPCALLPAKRALRYPAVAPQLLTALDPAPGDARHDPALSQATAQLLVIIRLVRVNLLGAVARSASLTAHERNGVHGRQQLLPVRDVRSREYGGKRQAVPVYRLMALGSRTASVHRRRADRLALRPPFFAPLARMKMLSTLARLQSIRRAASSLASMTSWSLCQTPALCQSRRRRQHVMPEPQPISAGSISHGMPLLSTKRMPVKAARSGTGGRPRLPAWARWAGRSGLITAQSSSGTSSSGTSSFAILGVYPFRHFC